MKLETIAQACAERIFLSLISDEPEETKRSTVGDALAAIKKEVLIAMYMAHQGPVHRLGHNVLPANQLVMNAYPQLTRQSNIHAYRISDTSWQVRIDHQVDPRYVGLSEEAAVDLQERLYIES